MSRRYPVCNAKEVIKILRKHGFLCVARPAVTKNGGTTTDDR
jgi:hypothetical protein